MPGHAPQVQKGKQGEKGGRIPGTRLTLSQDLADDFAISWLPTLETVQASRMELPEVTG